MRNVYEVESGGGKLTVEFRVIHDDPEPGSERVVVEVAGPSERAEQLLAMIAPRLEDALRPSVRRVTEAYIEDTMRAEMRAGRRTPVGVRDFGRDG